MVTRAAHGEEPGPSHVVGRYALYGEIAAGGMATVHLGRLLGPVGFTRTVAVKRLHPQFAKDPEFVAMFLDEARLAARVRHPNVVPTLDVVAEHGELFLVMEYVQGESLSRLVRLAREQGNEPIDPRIVASIVAGALHGLHAAHEATDERGEPLHIVHRDVSPQNILVGADGVARVLDFGVAKAAGRLQVTREGRVKGKLAYMAPEHLLYGVVTQKADVYAAGVVLWETLVRQRLFDADNEYSLVNKVRTLVIPPPSRFVPGLPPAFDAVALRGAARDPNERYSTAHEMAVALERCAGVASTTEVADWVRRTARDALAVRAALVKQIEAGPASRPERRPAEAPSPSSPRDPKGFVAPIPRLEHDPDDEALTLERRPGPANTPAPVPTPAGAHASATAPKAGDWPALPLVRHPGRTVTFTVLIAAALIVVGAAALHARAPAASPPVDTATPPPSDSATLAAPPPPTPPPPIPASPSATTSTSTPTSTSTSTATPTPPRAPRRPTARPPPPPSCDPPYTIDSDGIQRLKRECIPK